MKKFKILKVVGLFLLLALAMVLIVRCEKDPLVVVPVKYTVEAFVVNVTITPSKVEVSKGSDVILAVKANDGFKIDSVTVNGVKKPLTGNTFSVLNINSNYKIEATGKITELGLLIQKPWKCISFQMRFGGPVWETRTDEGVGSGTYIFGKDYRYQHFDIKSTLTGDGSYTLTPDSLIVGGISYRIVILNGDTLRIKDVAKYYPSPGDPLDIPGSEAQYTYTH